MATIACVFLRWQLINLRQFPLLFLPRLSHPYSITNILEFALTAERRDGLAEVLPVGDKQIVEGDPMRRW